MRKKYGGVENTDDNMYYVDGRITMDTTDTQQRD